MVSFRGHDESALASSIVAAAVAFGARSAYGQSIPILLCLILGSAVMLVVYGGMLLIVTGQKSFYLDILRGLKGAPAVKENDLISA